MTAPLKRVPNAMICREHSGAILLALRASFRASRGERGADRADAMLPVERMRKEDLPLPAAVNPDGA